MTIPPPPVDGPPPPPNPAPVGQEVAAPPASAPGKKSILPLLALIFAGAAFLFAVIPPTSAIAWAFAVTAIVLAIVALVKKAQPRALAIVAIILAPLAWLISIIVFVVAVAAGIGSIESTPEQPDSSIEQPSEEAPAEEPEAPTEPAIGETVTNNEGVAVTFTAVQCGIPTAGPEFFEETAKGQFCQVNYTVFNGSEEKISLWASDVTGEIGGVEYETDGTISQFGGDYFTTELNPGLGTDAVVYIDIPADKALEYVVFVPEWSLFVDDIRVRVS